MQPLVSIIIINYNTKHLLKGCIDAILAQTYDNLEVIFIDNNSHDGSVELVQELYGKNPKIRIVDNPDNKGYSGAGNQGIGLAHGKYVVITNPDILYEPDYFEHAIAKMESDPKIAALIGKIKKYDFANHQKTNLIDTVGLFVYKNRRVIDNGQGLEDKGQFEQEKEIFGVSGACPLYRREALEDVKILGEYLDHDFFMYKEDIDLSWRFQLFGWKCWYYPRALAYHGRGTGVAQRFNNAQLLQERGKMAAFTKKLSYRNQRLMQVKNELAGNFWSDFFSIIGKEIAVLGYITFKEPYLWKSVWQFFRFLPKALRKRREIMRRKRVSAKEMKKWFRGQSEYVD